MSTTVLYIGSVAITLAAAAFGVWLFRREGYRPPIEWWIATGAVILSNAITNAVICFGGSPR